ncbi:hypothetical protein POF50_022695 [Streptomyces sp. SL13]|uniref:Uncharacterized protein n=1 Tax=Streptantibioticus silvisoli TaxID=2705255 RepID=A0AA90HC17_9ACTN|nr:hypothetical protein [Streptantibioticus silvisoli]MDI5972112.1 hypothetical protein [Streptantibioticus silvisoli]
MRHDDHRPDQHDDGRRPGRPARPHRRPAGPTRGARPAPARPDRGGGGPHGRPPLSSAAARQALRREVPSTLALLTGHDDFTAMRGYATFAFDDHPGYLRHAHGLLRSLTARGTHVGVVRFDPHAYTAWCAETGRPADDPDTRTRYVADVASGGAVVPYEGQPVADLVDQVALATARHATWSRAADVLARTGEADTCFDRACLALSRLFDAAGPGSHHLVCSVPLDDAPLVAVVHAERAADGTVDLVEADALTLCTLLAAGMATRTPGGLVLRTGDGTPEAPDHVRGWTLRDRWLHPLTEAQVFAAYCTDADTGDPVPPEPGVTYCAGTPLPPPRE